MFGLVIWGYEIKQASPATTVSILCPKCNAVTQHTLSVEWEIFHLYRLLRSLRWEKWRVHCVSCGTEYLLPNKTVRKVRRMSRTDPIPFFDRHESELLGGVILVAIILWAIFGTTDI